MSSDTTRPATLFDVRRGGTAATAVIEAQAVRVIGRTFESAQDHLESSGGL
jgi:hypothetical protein